MSSRFFDAFNPTKGPKMKALITSLCVATILISANASANEYEMVRNCVIDADRYIKMQRDMIEKLRPEIRSSVFDDSEIPAIREAEAECTKKTPEERVALKAKWHREFSDKHGLKQPQQPPSSTGGAGAFSPGSLFNPIHVQVH